MNGKYLYEAMGGIGPDLIAEGEYLSLGKTTARKLLELAACLALCLGLGLAAVVMMPVAGIIPSLSQQAEPAASQSGAVWLLPYAAAAAPALAAWILPVHSLLRKREGRWIHLASCLCSLASLMMQLGGLVLLCREENNIIKNYVNYILAFAPASLLLTAAVNGIVWLVRHEKWNEKWNEKRILNGLYLLLCLLSAIQYGFLIGTAKAYVAFGGFAELTAVIVTAVLYGLYLFTGRAKIRLRQGNLILLVMQTIPLLLSIPFRLYFCTAYHALCILLGVCLLFSQKNRTEE